MSLAKVAQLAQVSPTTVSRVINNNPLIAPATAERVRGVMLDMGYSPAHPTRRRGPHALSRQGIRTGQVAIVPLGMTEQLMYMPFVAETWGGVRAALEERDLATVLMPITDLSRPPALLDCKKIDGVILEGVAPPAQLRRALRRLPAVYVYSTQTLDGELPWCDRVVVDDQAVGRLAAAYLLRRGHRHVAFMNPAPGHSAYPVRGRIFQEAIRAAGGTVESMQAGPAAEPRPLAVHHERDKRAMAEMVDRLLKMQPRPTGLFVPSDMLTAYVYSELYRHGVRPGADVDVVSCNNERPLLAGLYPPPATVDTQSHQIGRRAVEQLLLLMADPLRPRGVEIRVPPLLVEPEERPNVAANSFRSEKAGDIP